MKVGVVVYSNDPETAWNAFRFANFARAMGDEVNVFLLSKGVESNLVDTPIFKVTEQIKTFTDAGGKIFACGTCLEIHQLKAPESFKVSTLKDLYQLVKESDKIVTF